MLMSLAVVFFGMQLMMVGPLKGRLDNIQARIDSSENNMNKLVAVRDSVFRTNDLLTGLEDQTTRLQSLESSISNIATFRTNVEQEAEASTAALVALDKVSLLQDQIINGQEKTQQASAQLVAIQ